MSNFAEPEIEIDVASEETTALNEEQKHHVDPMGSGFVWYTPPMASSGKPHERYGNQEWSIAGHDMQVLVSIISGSI